MGGRIPIQTDPVPADTDRNLKKDQLTEISRPSTAVNGSYYGYHWRHFGAFDSGYRDISCTTGGEPYGVAAFLVTGSPKDYFFALDKGMGEINTRPQWMAPEAYKYINIAQMF